ncbi:Protein of unknown function (DUF3592) [Saprospira grandis DSM 2844]|uniref:DUF3592 domain-containing protein n=1 Tax=Saprospira grandis DSM 2844 TaxID=694433 RepID=J1I596_9BACT|nr:DUF3592 domain-containing protein [Saprospira grandis]EJF53940.1 Protein of unknown function (DUF3592) [Saprospira grandis DSM 2844]
MPSFFPNLAKRFGFWLLLLFPSYLLSIQLKTIYQGQQLQLHGQKVNAEVVAVQTHTSYDDDGDQSISYSTTFEYQDENDRILNRKIENMQTYYYEGQSVEMIYEKDQPKFAIPNTFEMIYQDAVMFSVIILGTTFIFGLFVYVAFLKTS